MTPLIAHLERLQRRARLTRFATYCCVTGPLAIGILPAVYLFTESSTALAGVFLTALGGAGIASVAHTPSLRMVAAAADRALSLDDRAVTAFQHLRHEDVVSQLVLADAERRLNGIDAARVFPFGLPRHLSWLISASAIVATIGFVANTRSVRLKRQATATPAAAQNAGSSRNAGASPDASTRDGSPHEARVGRNSPTSGTEQRDPAPPGDLSVSRIEGSARREGNAVEQAGAPRAAAPAKPGRESGSEQAAPPFGTAASAGALNARGAAAAYNPYKADAPPLAGGVSTNAPLTRGQSSGASITKPFNPSKGRGAVNQAEAAMAHDEIPPALRAYVRAYFESIRR